MDSSLLFWIGLAAIVLYLILLNKGIKAGVERRFKAKVHEIEREKAQALATIETQKQLVAQMYSEFSKSHVGGRRWLISLIVEALAARDDQTVQSLTRKARPAYRAADEVKRVKGEKRVLAERAKHLEYPL